MDRDDLDRRIGKYADRKGLALAERLGAGIHGSVFAVVYKKTGDRSAVKGHERESAYRRERDVYLRLREHDINSIRDCNVPVLVDFDDTLWVIEMTVVSRPFVLDFAESWLDWPPDFTPEVMADWEAEKREQFGHRWVDVEAILRDLEGYGVFMLDVNPGNISFGD
jgi:hypothetical protein